MINFVEDQNMVPRVKIAVTLMIFAAMIVICGCDHESGDIPTSAPTDVPTLIIAGWDYFENGNYDSAIENFAEAASRNALETEAYLGLGWSYLRDSQFAPAISNVFNVSSLIGLGVVTDQQEIDRYMAESHACLAGAYSGLYPEDIALNAQQVVTNVDLALSYDPNFFFSHDSTVNSTALQVNKADAQFVLEDYDGAFYTISSIDNSLMIDPAYVQLFSDVAIEVETLFDSTTVMGYGRLTVPDAQFIDVTAVSHATLTNSAGDPLPYFVEGFTTAGTQTTFYGTPVPQDGDTFLVSYYNAVDYILFMAELRGLIDQYR